MCSPSRMFFDTNRPHKSESATIGVISASLSLSLSLSLPQAAGHEKLPSDSYLYLFLPVRPRFNCDRRQGIQSNGYWQMAFSPCKICEVFQGKMVECMKCERTLAMPQAKKSSVRPFELTECFNHELCDLMGESVSRCPHPQKSRVVI